MTGEPGVRYTQSSGLGAEGGQGEGEGRGRGLSGGP